LTRQGRAAQPSSAQDHRACAAGRYPAVALAAIAGAHAISVDFPTFSSSTQCFSYISFFVYPLISYFLAFKFQHVFIVIFYERTIVANLLKKNATSKNDHER
jgi:hypothetical protein